MFDCLLASLFVLSFVCLFACLFVCFLMPPKTFVLALGLVCLVNCLLVCLSACLLFWFFGLCCCCLAALPEGCMEPATRRITPRVSGFRRPRLPRVCWAGFLVFGDVHLFWMVGFSLRVSFVSVLLGICCGVLALFVVCGLLWLHLLADLALAQVNTTKSTGTVSKKQTNTQT